MPMFQVDGGRSTPVQPLQPARTIFGAQTPTVVADHLDSLLGEQLLPLRARRPDRDEPHLLAVDAAGQPVVVEVVAVLDEVACLRALRYAGRAARLSTQDLAGAYRGGPERFAAHLAAFRETVPATSLLSPVVRGGARLLLVCSEVDPEAADVLEFLLQPGWQVEVLQVGVIAGADGRRIVDVSPVTRTPPPRRAMEPTSLHLVRDRSPLTAEAPVAPTVPAASTMPTMPVRPRVSEPARDPRRPDVVAPAFAVRASASAGLVRPDDADAESYRDVGPVLAPDAVPSSVPAPGPDPAPSPASAPSSDHATRPDPRLATLARRLGEPVALMWVRQRRGQRFEALLHPDGVIELADGSCHRHPDAAAAAAAGAESAVDGWRVWRLGDDGPALADVLT